MFRRPFYIVSKNQAKIELIDYLTQPAKAVSLSNHKLQTMIKLLLLLCLSSTNAVCSSYEVRNINKCLYSLDKPDPDSSTLEEKCQYATTYFRCFSGSCCKDPNFKEQIAFIQKDIEAMGCSSPVECAGATQITTSLSLSIIFSIVISMTTFLL